MPYTGVAMADNFDHLQAQGVIALPSRLVAVAGPRADAADASERIQAQFKTESARWQALPVESLAEEAQGTGFLASIASSRLLRYSKAANNLGVLLENVGNSEAAETCYREARRMNPENVSSLLNLVNLASTRNLADYRCPQTGIRNTPAGQFTAPCSTQPLLLSRLCAGSCRLPATRTWLGGVGSTSTGSDRTAARPPTDAE